MQFNELHTSERRINAPGLPGQEVIGITSPKYVIARTVSSELLCFCF